MRQSKSKESPKKEKNRRRIPIWLIGAVVGALLGITTVWFDYAKDDSINSGLMIALLAALIGIVIDTRATLEWRNGIEDRRGKLMQRLEECSLMEDDVLELLEAAARIRIKNAFLLKHASQSLDVCRDELERAAQSLIHKRMYDINYLLNLVHDVKETIFAISTDTDYEFWLDDDGQRYLLAQQEAIANRPITVNRIFVLGEGILSKSEKLTRLKQVMDDQKDKGIHVKWIHSETLSQHIKEASDYKDFVIIDKDEVVETITTPEGKASGMDIHFSQEYIEKRTVQFFDYWNLSRSLDEVSSLKKGRVI